MIRCSSLTGAILNIYVAPEYRNSGFGLALLNNILDRCKNVLDCQFVKAMIKKDNIASKKLFEKAGFVFSGEYPDRMRNGKLVLFDNYYKYYREL